MTWRMWSIRQELKYLRRNLTGQNQHVRRARRERRQWARDHPKQRIPRLRTFLRWMEAE